MYSLIRTDGKVSAVIKDKNTFIPIVPDNTDYQAFIKWNDSQVPESKLDLADQPPPEKSYQEKREAEYPSTNELIVALWEAVVENRPAASIALQNKRTEIKNKYPKPDSK